MAIFAKRSPFPGVGDIGFLMSSRTVNSLLFFSYPSHRVGKVELDVSDRRFHAFCVYSPTSVDHQGAESHTFFDELSYLVNNIPLCDHILVCVDLKAPWSILVVIIIIIMGIFRCYFSGEHIALSYKKLQRCEHRIRKNQQIKSTEHGAS